MNPWTVKAPAIAMMVMGAVSALLVLLRAVTILAHLADADPEGKTYYLIGAALGLAITLPIYILVFLGAWKMFQMESWGLALTGAILVTLCMFFCMGFPVGVWAIVVLSLRDVRRAFD